MKRTLKEYYNLMKNETNKENLIIEFINDILENDKEFINEKVYPIFYVKDETYSVYSDIIRVFFNDNDCFEINVRNLVNINKEKLYEFMKTKVNRFVLTYDNPYSADNDFEIIIESPDNLKNLNDYQYIKQYIDIWDEIIPETEKKLIKEVIYKQGIESYGDMFKYRILQDIEYETLEIEYVPNQLLDDELFVKRLNDLGYNIHKEA